jgi:hypothetical protein
MLLHVQELLKKGSMERPAGDESSVKIDKKLMKQRNTLLFFSFKHHTSEPATYFH